MKILRIIASVDPRSGGPIEGLLQSAKAMRDAGHRTEVVTLDDPQAEWVRTFPLPVYATGPATRPYGYTPRLVSWLRTNRRQYDAAIVHGIWNYASFGTWRGLAGGTVPYFLFTHGMLDPWFREAHPFKHWLKQLYWLAAEGRVLRDASCVLFTTEQERHLARGVFWGHSYNEYVPGYGTADPPPESEAQRLAFREMVPELAERPFLLFLSRIHPKKGCDLLIDAFARVSASEPDLALVIAGPDQVGLREGLCARAAALGVGDRIYWPGMLSGDAKWGAYRAAEGFILPSHQENFGIVVAEALACGTPALITNKVNIWCEVEKSGGGLVEDDNVDGVERLIRRFTAQSDIERRLMGSSARQCFEQNFAVECVGKRLAELISDTACK